MKPSMGVCEHQAVRWVYRKPESTGQGVASAAKARRAAPLAGQGRRNAPRLRYVKSAPLEPLEHSESARWAAS